MQIFEWFQIGLGILALILVPLIGSLVKAFQGWADKLESITTILDARFADMTDKTEQRWTHMDMVVTGLRQDFHEHRICVERRLTRMESKVD